jgi:hypothetical protein
MEPQIIPVANRSPCGEAQSESIFAAVSITIGTLMKIRILASGSDSDERPRNTGYRHVPKKNPRYIPRQRVQTANGFPYRVRHLDGI